MMVYACAVLRIICSIFQFIFAGARRASFSQIHEDDESKMNAVGQEDECLFCSSIPSSPVKAHLSKRYAMRNLPTSAERREKDLCRSSFLDLKETCIYRVAASSTFCQPSEHIC